MTQGTIHSKNLGNTTSWYPAYLPISFLQFCNCNFTQTICIEYLYTAGTMLGTGSTKINT